MRVFSGSPPATDSEAPRPARPPGRAQRRTLLRRLLLLALACGALGLSFLFGAYIQRKGHLMGWPEKLSAGAPRNLVRAMLSAPDLPKLTVEVRGKHMRRVEEQRQRALERGVLQSTDDDLVPGTIRLDDGDALPINLRLKGDMDDHFRGQKWSFRIHMKGEGRLWGMRRFSIQHPLTRKYHVGWAWLEHARRLGLAAPRYRFVEVTFNGTPKGIYAVEEHFSMELLANCGRAEGPILKWDDDPLWENWARGVMRESLDYIDEMAPGSYRLSAIECFQERYIAAHPELAAMRDTGTEMLLDLGRGKRSPSDVFDAELMGRMLAFSELWNSGHALNWRNLRFYMNPETSRLEPIASDGDPNLEWEPDLLLQRNRDSSRLFRVLLLSDAEIAASYVRTLDELGAPVALDALEAEIGESLDEVLAALHKEWPGLHEPWAALRRNQKIIRANANPAELAVAYLAIRGRAPDAAGDGPAEVALSVQSLVAVPVEVLGYRVAGSERVPVEGGPVWLPLARRDEVNEANIAVKHERLVEAIRDGGEVPGVTVEVRMVGREEIREIPARVLGMAPWKIERPGVEEALRRHPFLERGPEERWLRVRTGTHTVPEDLVLPASFGLQILPGTTLRFAEGAGLFCGGPLRAEGEPEGPIVLEPEGESWPGMIVDRAPGRSRLEHVEVRGARGPDRPWLGLGAGVGFYRSDLSIESVRIVDGTAPVALQIGRAELDAARLEIGPGGGDGLRAEFASVTLEHSAVHDLEGDGLDIRGGVGHAWDVAVQRVRGRGIVAAEGARVDVRRPFVKEVGVAFASRDAAHLTISGGRVEGADVGFAVYATGAGLPPGSIEATGVETGGIVTRALVSEAARATLDGRVVESTEPMWKRLREEAVFED